MSEQKQEPKICHWSTNSALVPVPAQKVEVVSQQQNINLQQITMHVPCIGDKCTLWDIDNNACIDFVVKSLECKKILKELKMLKKMDEETEVKK